MMMSLTGRYAHRPINPDDPPALKQSRPDHPYRTVGCVFNHKSFYANSQVQELNFSLATGRKWSLSNEGHFKNSPFLAFREDLGVCQGEVVLLLNFDG